MNHINELLFYFFFTFSSLAEKIQRKFCVITWTQKNCMEIFNMISLEQLYASKLYILSYVQTKLRYHMRGFTKHVF